MLEFARWKYIVIALVLAASVLYSLPNVFPQDPAVQIAATGKIPVDAALVTRAQTVLKENKIPFNRAAIEGKSLLVRLASTEHQLRAADALRPAMGSDFTVAMNLASNTPTWLSSIGSKPMTLGLDLQGGVHFLLQVDQKAARAKRVAIFADEIENLLKDNKISTSDVTSAETSIKILLADPASRNKAFNILQANQAKLTFDVQGDANQINASISNAELDAIAASAIEQNILTLRNRINGLGVAEPIVQRQGNDRIIVQLPGVQDTAKAKEILGSTSTLEYRAVVEGDAFGALNGAPAPLGSRVYIMKKNDPSEPDVPVLLSKRIIVSGDQLVNASPGVDQQSGQPNVSVKLNAAGGKRMFNHTLQNTGKPMAVVFIERIPAYTKVDGKEVRSIITREEVVSVANINGVFGPEFQTTGLDPAEARKLSEQLKAGSLAAPVDIVEERVVGPSLGAANVERGVKAVVFSFVFVLIFFVVYYKMFGVITNLALLLNLLMVVALMSMFGATMTLPGFAGIALTVGMSVDANVLINERIREELRGGMTPLASIAAGYDKASGTIADANVTALLGGIAMAVFGSGPISGFGVTLIIGILTSMFTAVSVSRGIATLMYGSRRKMTGLSI
jgi:preprotein translocase subunit SecD